jgi:hypothetical protein
VLEREMLAPIAEEFSGVSCRIDGIRETGRGYYTDLCFHIDAITSNGDRVQLADGGSVNWTQRILSNAKERLVISGIGTERLCMVFAGGHDA